MMNIVSNSIVRRRASLFLLTGVFVFALAMVTMPQKSRAQSCCSCTLATLQEETLGSQSWFRLVGEAFAHIELGMVAHKIWINEWFWSGPGGVGTALMFMAEQFSAIAFQQTQIIGSFMDAKFQMQTQQVLQTLRARAHKDYHPSIGMCEFGSNAKSLAASERIGEIGALVMSERTQERHLGSAYNFASDGPDRDIEARITQFRTKFCDPMDHNRGLMHMCQHQPRDKRVNEPFGGMNSSRLNKDIDYSHTLGYPYTLNVNFVDHFLTDNEEEVLALAANLYGHKVFSRIAKADDLETKLDGRLVNMQEHYMDARAHLAKLSVAENSFNAITALKSQGSPGASDFLHAVFTNLGVESHVIDMLGEQPSYYAQMEVLTKKLYQNPDFYTNLYSKPADVRRKGVAMQAIGLMQKFDLFKSHLRNEANLSMLLELSVSDLQERIENEIGKQKAGGTEADETGD